MDAGYCLYVHIFVFFSHLNRLILTTLIINVNKLATSAVDGLAAPKPPSRVAISCSDRVSISGSIWASGATLIPRPSRARDL